MNDLIASWRFSATLQLRTPLAVLNRHGDNWAGPIPPADEPDALWHGTWVPIARTWKELSGMDLPEFEFMVASEIGPIPADGSEFLPFLKRLRAIAESSPDVDRWSLLLSELDEPKSVEFCARLGGAEAIRKKLKIPRPRLKSR